MGTIASYMLTTVTTVVVMFQTGVGMKAYSDEPKGSRVILREWGAVSEGFQLSAQLERELVGACEPIFLSVCLRNATEEVLSLVETSPDMDYKIVIKDEEGRTVPLTRYGKRVLEAGGLRRVIVKINGGQQLQHRLLINRIYDMTVSGRYQITVERSVFKRDAEGFAGVRSNTVTVRVSEQYSASRRAGQKPGK